MANFHKGGKRYYEGNKDQQFDHDQSTNQQVQNNMSLFSKRGIKMFYSYISELVNSFVYITASFRWDRAKFLTGYM